ncbi:MAG: sugar phosphate isomerase/epimerase family protein [Povalibacter sp.]
MLKWIAAALALLPVSGFAAETASSCKVGVQLYSFRNDLDKDLPGTLARIKKLGVNCVEPYSLHKLTAEQLRAEFDRAGLKVVSFHLPGELREGDPAEAVRTAKVLGAQQVGIAWIKESDTDVVNGSKLMAAASRLNGMCPAAKAAGLKVFYHPHGYEFHEGDPEGKLFERFVNELEKDCVVLQLDAFWVAYAGQDPVKFMQKYGNRVSSYHVKDMASSLTVAPFDGSKWKGPLPDEAFAPLGKGKIDQVALIKLGKQYKIKWFILEDETTHPFENIALALPYMKANGLE